jgi:hypothetical protein
VYPEAELKVFIGGEGEITEFVRGQLVLLQLMRALAELELKDAQL